MTAPTLAAAVTSLTDVAARWADAPDAGPQVLATLAALLTASHVEVVQSLPPELSAVAGRWPLPGPDGAMGTVLVHRSAPLSADELVLTQVAAGLLVVQERRDARIRAMGQELEARLKALDRQRLFMERAVDSLPFGF